MVLPMLGVGGVSGRLSLRLLEVALYVLEGDALHHLALQLVGHGVPKVGAVPHVRRGCGEG